MDDHNGTGKAAQKYSRGLGIGLSFVLSSQIFPFMLSSAFTARNIVQEKDDVAGVQTDMLWALAFSIVSSAILGYFMGQDWIIFIVGSLFATALFITYSIRGNIPLW